MRWSAEWMAGLMIVAGVGILMAPVVRYVLVGWRAKRRDILDGLNADARLAYVEMFERNGTQAGGESVVVRFEQVYARWYGRRFFAVPSLLLLTTALIAVSLVAFTVLHGRGYLDNPLFDIPDVAIAAIAGAYMWIVNDLTSRARRLDVSPADVLLAALRMVVAVPMGYAVSSLLAEGIAPFVAFAMGAFPLGALLSILRRLANRNLGLEDTAEEARDNLIKLQGVNPTIAERLANEDVSTITQISYCDPVRLTMRSNLTFNFIVDCMNQGLAWMYLEDVLKKLTPLGMRGAIEIKCFIDDLDDEGSGNEDDAAAHARAVAALPMLAEAAGQKPETLQIVFRQIALDPFTVFLYRIWT